ncbi:MAG: type II secretion system protein [Candidatus Rokubacteria bacterium]|nr:type II secretion system protein [Candidatus Rokubacteria bacterium]
MRASLRTALSDRGFSLPELLVVIVILALMMMALFGTLDVSQKAYSRATAAEDAQTAARSVLERVATDLRMIGSFYFGAGNAGYPITAFSTTSITFLGDVNGDANTTLSAASGMNTVLVTSATGFTQDELIYLASGTLREVARVAAISGTSFTLGAPPAAGTWTGLSNLFPSDSIARSVEQVTWTYDAGARTITRTDNDGAVQMMDQVAAFTMTAYDVNGNATVSLTAIDSVGVELTATASGGARRTMKIRVQLRSMRTV